MKVEIPRHHKEGFRERNEVRDQAMRSESPLSGSLPETSLSASC